jgi:hypothetical protein
VRQTLVAWPTDMIDLFRSLAVRNDGDGIAGRERVVTELSHLKTESRLLGARLGNGVGPPRRFSAGLDVVPCEWFRT